MNTINFKTTLYKILIRRLWDITSLSWWTQLVFLIALIKILFQGSFETLDTTLAIGSLSIGIKLGRVLGTYIRNKNGY